MTHYLKRAHQVGRTFGDNILPSAEAIFVDRHEALRVAVDAGISIEATAKAAFEAAGILIMAEEGVAFLSTTFSKARAISPEKAAEVWMAFANGYAEALERHTASHSDRLADYLRRDIAGDESLEQEMIDWCIDGRLAAE